MKTNASDCAVVKFFCQSVTSTIPQVTWHIFSSPPSRMRSLKYSKKISTRTPSATRPLYKPTNGSKVSFASRADLMNSSVSNMML